MTADDVIAALKLQPHPEGGFYAETFRDGEEPGRRPVSTAIYFLLRAGEVSAWHRVTDAAEVWHFYAGAALELEIAPPDGGASSRLRLGPALTEGERPQAVVPAGWWQRAACAGDWSLAGCTVAPGFLFDRFELAAPGWNP